MILYKRNKLIAYAEQLDLMPKPNIFIIEGPDFMGKTVLAKFIARKLKAAYFHSTAAGALKVAQADYMRNTLDNVIQCVSLSGLDVVMDRFWPSEVCYGPVLRPDGRPIVHDGITAVHLPTCPNNEIFATLVPFNPIYIFCLSDNPIENYQLAKDREISKGHLYSLEDYSEIYQNYLNLATKLMKDSIKLSVYNITTHGSNLDAYVEDVISLYGNKT